MMNTEQLVSQAKSIQPWIVGLRRQLHQHPELMYEEFEGHPLRKDYPIDKQQPLMELKEIEERHTYGRKF